MMNNGDGNRVSQRFQLLKERQDLMHRRYMDKWNNMRERETQEINHAKQFMRTQPPTVNNKSTSKNKTYGNSNKLSNSNTNTEQSSLNNTTSNNNKNVNFNNGPMASGQPDSVQTSQKRTYDQFNGTPTSNEETLAKVSRVSEQSKQQFINSRNNSNNAYDVNSNIQPNVNIFQTSVSKEKPNLSLPVSSMNLGLTKSTVTTPQVVKYVEKLLEQSGDVKLQSNIKVEASSTPNAQSSNDPGFDENIRFYGEFVKTEVKTENEKPQPKSDTTTQIQTQINNQMSNAGSTQNLQIQPSPQQQQQQQQPSQQQQQKQQKLKNQNTSMPPQQLTTQQIPNAQVSNQPQWQNNVKKPVQSNSDANRTLVNRSTQQQAMDITTPMQILSRNMGNNNAQMMGQNTSPKINQQSLQQMSQPNFSNNSTMMNTAPMNIGGVNTNSSINNPNTNIMNSNNMMNNISSSMSTDMMQNNNAHFTTPPPSLPRLNQTQNRVLPNKEVNQGQQINNQQYIPQQNHVGSYTNGKLQDLLKRRQMKMNQQHPISNQMMHPFPHSMQQNSFMYNNDISVNNQQQQQQLNSMQSQQNGMAFFPPPYPMDNTNNQQQMFSNNTGGYFQQTPNKPAGKMLQEFMGLSNQRQVNGMYNIHQNMNQQQMFNMNNKAPPRYNTQMSTNMMNQAAMMSMNHGMNTSARLTHFSQPDSSNMVMPGPPGMKNQLGMNMNAMNRYPPPLSRNMMQSNSNLVSNSNSNNQLYDGSYMNQDMNNFPNMGNSANAINTEQMIMRAQLLRFQRQQQQQLLSQKQHHHQQQQNMNYPTSIMNSDMQQMMRQQSHPQQLNNLNSNTNNNTNSSIANDMQQQYTANQNYIQQQQSSNFLQQGNLQTAQMQQSSQQTTPRQTSLQTQQNSSLYSHPASLDNSTSIGNTLNNSNAITDTSASLLETSNTENNEPNILPDDNIDEILENPSDKFDLISILSHE